MKQKLSYYNKTADSHASIPQADLINQLYQGKLKDYVRCLECGYESWRIDTYLDIPLVIRPFGASQAYGSVVCSPVNSTLILLGCLKAVYSTKHF